MEKKSSEINQTIINYKADVYFNTRANKSKLKKCQNAAEKLLDIITDLGLAGDLKDALSTKKAALRATFSISATERALNDAGNFHLGKLDELTDILRSLRGCCAIALRKQSKFGKGNQPDDALNLFILNLIRIYEEQNKKPATSYTNGDFMRFLETHLPAEDPSSSFFPPALGKRVQRLLKLNKNKDKIK